MTTTTRPEVEGTDGRSTRWEAHRRARREELVQATLRAITHHGPGVGMDEIATEAGTSKTALYRHFADKDELYLAVAERVGQRILRELSAAVADAGGTSPRPRAALGAVISTYLHLVEDDPDVYRFVTSHAGTPGDPLARVAAAISSELAVAITQRLAAAGVSARTAAPWGHGLVGMVRAAADHWMSSPAGAPRTTADELAAQLTALAWGGLSHVPVPAPPSTNPTRQHEERP